MTLIATAADPIPAGAHSDWMCADDGTRFRAARWTPATATRGTLVVLNGRTEFIEKYFETIGQLLQRGFAVATLDWRGQGRSDRALANPRKGHVGDFREYIGDLHQAIENFVRPACPEPLRILAHSMGGNIALRYLHDHPQTFERAIFSSPMWGVGSSLRPGLLMRAMSAVGNGLGFGSSYVPFAGGDQRESSRRFEDNVLTSDPKRFQRMVDQLVADPRLALGAPTQGWARAAIASLDAIHAPGFAEAIAIPVRVCSGSADSVVPPASHVAIAERLPHGQRTLIVGARHELLIEADAYRDRFFDAFDDFMPS